MPVPVNLLSNASIFCYSSNLFPAAQRLQKRLQGVTTGLYTVYYDYSKKQSCVTEHTAGPSSFRVAWIVGHGFPSNERIGTLSAGQNQYAMTLPSIHSALPSGCIIVDTCCSPDTRRIIARDTLKLRSSQYYCTDDANTVMALEDTDVLDTWWDTNKMKEGW